MGKNEHNIPVFYAGFWRRFLALLIDGVVLGLVLQFSFFIFSLFKVTVNMDERLLWAIFNLFVVASYSRKKAGWDMCGI